MKMGKKQLRIIIGIFSICIITLVIIIITNYTLRGSDESPTAEKTVGADTGVWNDLAMRQQNNGSWSDDLETTVIASNALFQSLELMDEYEEEIDWDDDGDGLETIEAENSKSVAEAENWTVNNYQQDAPIVTQSLVNYNGMINGLRMNVSTDFIKITQQTSDIILNTQSLNGSWNNDIQDTSFSLYVLKKNPDVDKKVIESGEKWLISQQKDGSWGTSLNDTLALLALHNSSYQMDNSVLRLILSQAPNGSFGDLETTAWAVIALSLYDVPGTSEAANSAREWLLDYDNVSDHELALISLAESEYITSEVMRLSGIHGVQKGKGPPIILLVITGVIGGIIIILTIIFFRLGAQDALTGVRNDIYEYVKAHPGVSQNALKRRLVLSSSSIRHHLKVLQRYEYILPHNDGKYIRYYVNRNGYSIYTNGNNYKEVISILRKNTAANIVKYIMDNPNINQQHLAKALDLHPSTIHWHTRFLLASNIISAKRDGKSIQYQIKGPIDINKLLGLAN
jgi:predicted transcriptional regulator